ncbi:MAG TPA: lipid-A-disaccharide synthase, partial [Myxococcales bacterium]|nr:lipid-A-disaccharide synthase [Myxococcales bacterium]
MPPQDELLIVALEASADLHGAAVLRELRALRPGLRAFGAGGPRMRAEGFEELVRAEDVSVMGIAEVLPALPRVLEAMDALRDAARERRPRAALLIDSPDFNLRLARQLRALRVPVACFIGPSVWAWRAYRVRQIARDVARMLVILPFEARFYEQHGVAATYVGNPLADAHRSAGAPPVRRSPLVLALLPGSRHQEIHRIWPPMLAAARRLRSANPELQLVVPVAPTVDRALFGLVPDVQFVDGRAPEVLAGAGAAIVASGTATLEAALALTPMVVVYRTSWLSWLVGRALVRLRFISLVNLLAGRALVPELLQSECTPERIAAAVAPL